MREFFFFSFLSIPDLFFSKTSSLPRAHHAPSPLSTNQSNPTAQRNPPESVLNALLPPKAEVTLLKLSNRSSAWAVAGQPLFFSDPDGGGRGNGPLLPTVYFLWAAVRASSSSNSNSDSPPLLPEVFTFSEVSSKVLGGADLFLQGFLPDRNGPPPGLAAGDLAVVRIEGNPFPFALGVMECSSAEAVAGGMKGKGLKLLHHAFDALWSLGDKATPSAGFAPSRVFPVSDEEGAAAAAAAPAAPAAPSAASAASAQSEDKEEEEEEEKEVERAVAGVAALGLSSSSSPAGDDNDSAAPPPPPPRASSSSSSSSATNLAFFPPDLGLSSPAGQDALAEYCLLSACARVDPSALPMLTSDFQKEMTRSKPAFDFPVSLDLKKSSFKQLSKLLKKFEKLGVLGTKVVRKQDMVTAVDAGHALVVEFLAKGGGGSGGGGNGGSGNGESSTTATAMTTKEKGEEAKTSSSSSSALPPITIEPAFRVSPSLRPVFAAPGGPPVPADDFYSEAEVKRALSSYLVAEKLLLLSESSSSVASPSSPSSVDRLLLAALFNKGSDRELAEGEGKTLPVSDLEERLLSRLNKYTRVRRSVLNSSSSPPTFTYEEKVFRGPLKKISIAVEDRQGGRKHVTRVWGVERYALSPESLASTLQKKFKTSASLSRVNAEEEEVALQGDAVKQLVAFFGSEYGIGGAHIEVKAKGGR